MTDEKDEEEKDFLEKYSKEDAVIEEAKEEKETYQSISFIKSFNAPCGEEFRPRW